jgi:hypothetical protein
VSETERDTPADRPASGENSAAETTEATTALGEEAVLNAAVAFAGHVVTAAQQAAEQAGGTAGNALREAVFRQYVLETATLCLRRLEESYAATTASAPEADIADLVRDGARQAREATSTVEALGDLSLDMLDRLLGAGH